MSTEDILCQRGYCQGEISSTLWRKWIAVGKKSWSHVMVSMSRGRPMVFAADPEADDTHPGFTAAKEEKEELIRLCGFEDGDKTVKKGK